MLHSALGPGEVMQKTAEMSLDWNRYAGTSSKTGTKLGKQERVRKKLKVAWL